MKRHTRADNITAGNTPPAAMGAVGYIRLNEAAAYLGVTPRTLRAWTARRLVPTYRPTCRLLLFRLPDLDAAMERFSTGRPIGGRSTPAA